MRLVYLGSPPFATPVLERLIDSDFRPDLVVTPPPRPKGRGRKVEVSPVATLANAAGIPVLQPASVKDEAFLDELRKVEAEVFLVVSYGELLRQEFLDLPSEVCLNVHPSLLPRWRGATPIQSTIAAGDEETGVTIQKVVLELDAGDVLVAHKAEVLPGETAGELAGRLAVVAGEAALDALERVASGRAIYTPQDPAGVTLCKRLRKEDGRIDWSRSARELERHVRAMNPWPGARTTAPGGDPLAVWRAQILPFDGETPPGTVVSAKGRLIVTCGPSGSEALELLEVQAAGKRAMSAGDYLLGVRFDAGERLGA